MNGAPDPPASFKTGRIATLDDNAKSSNDLGSSLVFEAEKFLRSARDSYGRLAGERDGMQARKEDFNTQISDQLNAVIQGCQVTLRIISKNNIFLWATG